MYRIVTYTTVSSHVHCVRSDLHALHAVACGMAGPVLQFDSKQQFEVRRFTTFSLLSAINTPAGNENGNEVAVG